MKKILFYSDCFVFGGCEKPIFEIMASPSLQSDFDYKFIYRFSKEYSQGMGLFRPQLPGKKTARVYFPDINTLNFYLARKIPDPALSRVAKKLGGILLRIFSLPIAIYEFLKLYFIFKSEDADIIHINNGGYPASLSCRVAVIAAKCAGKKKIILNVHNTAPKAGGIAELAMDLIVRRNVSKVVTGAGASGAALSRNRGFDDRKLLTIHHGIRPVREPDGANRNNRQISMVARLEKRKGHKNAVAAFKKIITEHPEYADIKLVFVGDGPLFGEIASMIREEGLEKNIKMLGHRNDYIDYVASSLFLLNPSLSNEDLPYIILEAMSLGIPVIGTNVGGIPEEIEDGISGIVIPPKESEKLADAMLELLSSAERRTMMGIAARERFNELFMVDKMVNKYISLYKEMVDYV